MLWCEMKHNLMNLCDPGWGEMVFWLPYGIRQYHIAANGDLKELFFLFNM